MFWNGMFWLMISLVKKKGSTENFKTSSVFGERNITITVVSLLWAIAQHKENNIVQM